MPLESLSFYLVKIKRDTHFRSLGIMGNCVTKVLATVALKKPVIKQDFGFTMQYI